MPDITTQVLSVVTETTSTGKSKYKVSTGLGVFGLWDAGIAGILGQYAMGQPVQLRIRQQPRRDGGVWEDIIAFAPPGQPLPAEQPRQQAATMQPVGQQQTRGDNYPPEVTARITKLSCLHYASIVVGHLMQGAGPEHYKQAYDLTVQLAASFYKQARSHENGPLPFSDAQDGSQAIQQPQALTGAQIASQTPGVSLGMPVQAQIDPILDADEWN